MARSKQYSNALWLVIFLFTLDFVTKLATHFYLPLMSRQMLWYPYGGIGVFRNVLGIEFSIVHATNQGAAWGVFADYQLVLTVLRVLFVGALISYAWLYHQKSRAKVPLMLIICGATANIIDYFIYGHVVDMFHFVFWGYDYPVFNVADSTIFIGIAWLLFSSKAKKQAVRRKSRA